MEEFKVDLFEREYGIPFPVYRHLSDEESKIIRDEFITKLNVEDVSQLFNRITTYQSFIMKIDDTDSFELIKVLNSLSLPFSDEILVNWHRLDDIDRFNTSDLDKYFHDIWFPSSDDIEIFDKSLTWIISVSHDGVVSCFRGQV